MSLFWIHVVSSAIRLTNLETTSSSFVTSHGLYGSSLYLVSRLSFIPSRIWEIPLTDMKLSGLLTISSIEFERNARIHRQTLRYLSSLIKVMDCTIRNRILSLMEA
ncbi:hypothetical protein HID58_074562 [Brassica napus]|uniref:Uncharacterized protein n=1 Tax=Brassica napus TaxID=3708 RepID=A0ABQ7YKB6_BRANA|nr:hypothetical protein HID58_074562 [Brassica napus]